MISYLIICKTNKFKNKYKLSRKILYCTLTISALQLDVLLVLEPLPPLV